MLRPHGGPQNNLLRNATIIVMFHIHLYRFLYPFELKVFGVTLRIWQFRSKTTGKSSHFLIYPYGWTPCGSPKPFVTECHHDNYVPYVSLQIFVPIRVKSFWCYTSNLAVPLEHHRKIFPFLYISVRLDPVCVSQTICYGMPP